MFVYHAGSGGGGGADADADADAGLAGWTDQLDRGRVFKVATLPWHGTARHDTTRHSVSQSQSVSESVPVSVYRE